MPADDFLPQLLSVIRQHWGFDSLRPLQEAAIRTVLDKRDSLVVLPTGGGKSLCYQAPAVYRGGTTVVLSPLISLMKDQVDALVSNGIPAVALNSAMSAEENRESERAIYRGDIRLVFASPERMATGNFRNLCQQVSVQSFAIDEAHCISHWGHDFRPEYRQLRQIKELFPGVSVHAFTATATEQVRQDIIDQLGLEDPEVLVGNFDRPNLTYRVIPRNDPFEQIRECMSRHPGEAGIIYCIRRKDVDELSERLRQAKVRVRAYHAGLEPEVRKEAQDRFVAEEVDVVVATVAFGMGIDRSNIRYVIHAGMPKSIEHYQQETGRAGRDGLEAECVLLYSAADPMLWRSIVEKSVGESDSVVDPQFMKNAFRHIGDMERYCHPVVCRHKALVQYFGQTYDKENCGACDLCLEDAAPMPESQTVAKKILSCVYRVQERFGMNHVAEVLRGADTESIRQWKHETLSTYGLLKDNSKNDVRDWIQQLIAQNALQISGHDRPILKLTPLSWDVMKDKATVRLTQQPPKESRKSSKADSVSWEGVDKPLFEALREWRREIATAKGVPPYVVFSDNTLRQLAFVRPSTLSAMQLVYGIGSAKLNDYGQAVLDLLNRECTARSLSRDVPLPSPATPATVPVSTSLKGAGPTAVPLFKQGLSIEDVASRLGRGRGTIVEYLCEYVQQEHPPSIDAWVSPDHYHQIIAAAEKVGADRLKPIYIELGEQIPYDEIRIALRYWANAKGS